MTSSSQSVSPLPTRPRKKYKDSFSETEEIRRSLLTTAKPPLDNKTNNNDEDTDSASISKIITTTYIPDDVWIAIGKSVGKLCDIKDYIHLGQTSKSMYHLLLETTTPSCSNDLTSNSNEIITDIIQSRIKSMRKCQIDFNRGIIDDDDGQNDDDANNDDDDHNSSDTTIGINSVTSSNNDDAEGGFTTNPLDALHCPQILTLQELSLFETMYCMGLIKENRIHFDFASTEIENESIERIQNIVNILQRYPHNATLMIDSHCGIAAPPGIAPRFSRLRGRVVHDAICDLENVNIIDHNNHDDDSDDPDDNNDTNYHNNSEEADDSNSSESNHEDRDAFSLIAIIAAEDAIENGFGQEAVVNNNEIEDLGEERIHTRGWGKRVAKAAARSQHPYGGVARDGKGWVEVFVRMSRRNNKQNDNDSDGDNNDDDGDDDDGDSIDDNNDDDAYLELPIRPSYYDNIEENGNEDTDDDDIGFAGFGNIMDFFDQ